MEFEEYMSSLTEQIHDKRAKHLVAEEIRNHIGIKENLIRFSVGIENYEDLKADLEQAIENSRI